MLAAHSSPRLLQAFYALPCCLFCRCCCVLPVRLTDAELTDNLLLLLLAGHDTSSTSLTNALSLLHDNPGAMEQLRQEQQQLVAKHGSTIDAALLKEMVSGEAVIRSGAKHSCCLAAKSTLR